MMHVPIRSLGTASNPRLNLLFCQSYGGGSIGSRQRISVFDFITYRVLVLLDLKQKCLQRSVFRDPCLLGPESAASSSRSIFRAHICPTWF